MFRSFRALYSLPHCSALLVAMFAANDGSPIKYLRQFWTTQDFSKPVTPYAAEDEAIRRALLGGMLAQILLGLGLIMLWQTRGLVAGELFGLALIVSYPVVWANLLGLVAAANSGLYMAIHPKKLGRLLVCVVLESQVRKLQKLHDFKIVAVAGSVGKTSTKLAIASMLEPSFRVRHQHGNYNDRVTVPLVFFGRPEPSIFNVVAWLKLFRANAKALRQPYPYDVVVVELGTDGVGFMKQFAYLDVDLAVVTAITPEHMEYFGSLDAVAKEEMAVFEYSKAVLVNIDDTLLNYLAGKKYKTYGLTHRAADYSANITADGLTGQTLQIRLPQGEATATNKNIGVPGAKTTLAAAAVAAELGIAPAQITQAAGSLQPFAGRMQLLNGIKDAVLIDDTYNSTPIAAKAALDTLYAAKTSQRIAILGSMNELGAYSRAAHREVGEYCDPKKLDWVITIGIDAKKYLSPAAKKRGCQLKSFLNPYEAGLFVQTIIKPKAIVLAKGSQNGVFAEEALKVLLAEPTDSQKLVRQSPYWLSVKQRQFPR